LPNAPGIGNQVHAFDLNRVEGLLAQQSIHFRDYAGRGEVQDIERRRTDESADDIRWPVSGLAA
jgi:hypothetical protein